MNIPKFYCVSHNVSECLLLLTKCRAKGVYSSEVSMRAEWCFVRFGGKFFLWRLKQLLIVLLIFTRNAVFASRDNSEESANEQGFKFPTGGSVPVLFTSVCDIDVWY